MIYSGTIVAKTNDVVPLFADGRPMHSKYNPDGEASTFGQSVETGFIVVAGVGGGFHLRSLLSRLRGDYFVLAVEEDFESLEFSLSLEINKQLKSLPNISCCALQDFATVFSKLYMPAAFSNFAFLPHRAWENHCSESCEKIREIINRGLKSISADFSVQSHFGKTWQKNILTNIGYFDNKTKSQLDKNKIAAVIAAGPSLDKSIEELKMFRNKYTIFSTDTAYCTLLKNDIHPEYVLSIDGQLISSGHFFLTPQKSTANLETCFVFDLCSNPDAVKLVSSRGGEIYFTSSHHPLCSIFRKNNAIPIIESGSGTVTIAACDFARQLGAKKIRVFGADFSYHNGKPYCKGTYLESNFSLRSDMVNNQETRYVNLMFRTDLVEGPQRNLFGDEMRNAKTSPVLQSYQDTLIDWGEKHGYKINDGFLCNPSATFSIESSTSIDFSKFMEWKSKAGRILAKEFYENKGEPLWKNETLFPLFPFAAWLRRKDGFNKLSFFELLKLAYTQLSRYTGTYEK